jgi:predicted CoA-binding protein
MKEDVRPEETILKKFKTVAVVGASPDPEHASNRVFNYLSGQGYNVLPVNPNHDRIADRKCYPDLDSIPEQVEVVDIFRKSEHVLPIVEVAIRIGAKAVWMQEGVINREAAAKARDAGLLVVMDKCMRKEHLRLNGKSG